MPTRYSQYSDDELRTEEAELERQFTRLQEDLAAAESEQGAARKSLRWEGLALAAEGGCFVAGLGLSATPAGWAIMAADTALMIYTWRRIEAAKGKLGDLVATARARAQEVESVAQKLEVVEREWAFRKRV